MIEKVDYENMYIVIPTDRESIRLEPEIDKNSVKCSFELEKLPVLDKYNIFIGYEDEVNIEVLNIDEFDDHYKIYVEVSVLEGSENVEAGFIVSGFDDLIMLTKANEAKYSFLKVSFDTRDVIDRL